MHVCTLFSKYFLPVLFLLPLSLLLSNLLSFLWERKNEIFHFSLLPPYPGGGGGGGGGETREGEVFFSLSLSDEPDHAHLVSHIAQVPTTTTKNVFFSSEKMR